MDPVKLLWQERRSDSSLIESVWTCRALEATSRAVIADPCICISLVKQGTDKKIVVAGPKTHAKLQMLPASYTCTTIRLKPGVGLKNFQTSELTDDTISIPADSKGRFRLEGTLFQFPDFKHAERIIENLLTKGHLNVNSPQDGQVQPRRTYSRRMRHLTGISPYKLHQLQRMHQALRLLKSGATAAEVVAELAFTDQAHFTHASKQFFGYTPKRLKELLQNP